MAVSMGGFESVDIWEVALHSYKFVVCMAVPMDPVAPVEYVFGTQVVKWP